MSSAVALGLWLLVGAAFFGWRRLTSGKESRVPRVVPRHPAVAGLSSRKMAEHNTESHGGPPPCEFQADKLILQVDELVTSRIDSISPVVDKLMGVIKESACAPGQEFAVEMALREALANAILHGNRQNPRKKVRICCAYQADRGILIVVKDEGEGFDPTKVPSPLVGENIYSAHGRGIYLLNTLMDEVRFERSGRELYMRKS